MIEMFRNGTCPKFTHHAHLSTFTSCVSLQLNESMKQVDRGQNLYWNYSLHLIPGIFAQNWIFVASLWEYALWSNTATPDCTSFYLIPMSHNVLEWAGPQGIGICNSSIYYLCKFNTESHRHSLKPHHKLTTEDTQRRWGRSK